MDGLFRPFRLIISIHAPRGGSDFCNMAGKACTHNFNPRSPWGERLPDFPVKPPLVYFNPRSPWGERLYRFRGTLDVLPFQSTLPVGGATKAGFVDPHTFGISIHAPRGGSDLVKSLPGRRTSRRFQSTLPVGGATADAAPPWPELLISIHAPRGGSDERGMMEESAPEISIHAPRGGSDGIRSGSVTFSSRFQSTLPVGGATCT